PPTSRSPLFPYTTLFRSHVALEPLRVGVLLLVPAGLVGDQDLFRAEWQRARDHGAVLLRREQRDHCVARSGVDDLTLSDEFKQTDRKSTRLNSSHQIISY